jgi:hypothetical protein
VIQEQETDRSGRALLFETKHICSCQSLCLGEPNDQLGVHLYHHKHGHLDVGNGLIRHDMHDWQLWQLQRIDSSA